MRIWDPVRIIIGPDDPFFAGNCGGIEKRHPVLSGVGAVSTGPSYVD